MGKPSAKTQITEYRMSVHLGVCHSADAIKQIFVNEKQAWSGRSTTQEDILINQPDLFGGPKKEGGLVGYVAHLPGRVDQVMPDHLTARWGLTPETSPAFRGITSLFFVGGGPVVTGQTTEGFIESLVDSLPLGQQNAGGNGFSWSWNNPIIAQTVWVQVERAPGNGPGSQVILDPTKALIGLDANPAHMIAECLTNTSWGMGSPASTIDTTSFNAAAATLYDELFGLSMKWTRQASIEDFIGEILDHIQASLYLNPGSGKWQLKLLRDDYDPATLKVINPDNARLTNFSRRLWGEAANQVVVTWTNPLNEEEESVSAEDLGALNSQGGSPVSIGRNYYGIRNRDLAFRVAQRDVRSAAAPLATVSVEVTREFWATVPGDVFLLDWPEKNISNLVVRVVSVDRGTPEAGTIKLSLLEDIFALEKPPITTPQDGGWVDPSDDPEPIDAVEILTLPSYFVASSDLQSAAVTLEYPEVLAAVLGYSESPDVRSYTLVGPAFDSGGATIYASHGSKSVVERTVLPAGLPWETESRLQDILVLNRSRGPKVGGFVFLGAGSDGLMEIAQVTGFDDVTREWIIARGVLDTVPRAWAAGTPAWFVNKGLNIVDEVELRAVGETVDYKLLPRTSKGVLPIAAADTVSETLSARPHLPLRPANVKVNGTAFGSFNGGAATELTVTWATRNRMLEDAQVVFWDAGPVAPEYEQGTVVTVYDPLGNSVYEQWGLWTENELVLQRSWFDRWASVTIAVTSRRRDLNSLQGHSIQVTGLAANPAAPLPPLPPIPGPPPSPDAAPAAGAWSVTGSAFTLNSAGRVVSAIPAILVSGARDRADAIELVVRYRKVGTEDWFYLAGVALSDLPTQSSTTNVIALTQYHVEVAYRSAANILSNWRSLGEVTTGEVIAGGVGDLTYAEINAALGFLGDLGEEETAALQNLGQLVDAADLNAQAIWAHIIRQAEDRERFEKLVHQVGPNGEPIPIGTALATETETRVTESEAFQAIFTALGAWSAGNTAYILNGETVWVDATQSFAEYQQAITTQFGDAQAAITSEQTARVTADEVFAQNFTMLGGRNGTGDAFVFDLSKIQLTTGGNFASRLQAIETSANNASAAVLVEQTARANADSALASQLTTVQATVGSHTTSISQLFSADTALGARYGLRLNVDGHITGFVANNDGTQGGFVFVGDFFKVATSAGDKQLFSVTGSLITLINTRITGDLVVDGTITGDKIIGGAVTDQLSYEAITNAALGTSAVTDIAFTYVSSGGKHLVQVYGDIGTTTSSPAGAHIELLCDGIVVGACNLFCPGSWGGDGRSFPVNHTPGAGSHNYAVRYTGTAGSGASRINRTLVVVTELKK